MSAPTRVLDLSTRYFWRVVGRQIDINGEDRWLASPSNTADARGDDWLDVLESAGRVRKPQAHDGLLAAFSALDGPQFESAKVDDRVRDFYERTASWQMEVWSQWNALFAPGGELIARLWGRRVGQLALPVQPLSVSRGMASAVRIVDDDKGDRMGAAWVRDLKSDGSKVYSGFYPVTLVVVDDPHGACHSAADRERLHRQCERRQAAGQRAAARPCLVPARKRQHPSLPDAAQRRRRILLVTFPLSVFRRRRRLFGCSVRRELVRRTTSAPGDVPRLHRLRRCAQDGPLAEAGSVAGAPAALPTRRPLTARLGWRCGLTAPA